MFTQAINDRLEKNGRGDGGEFGFVPEVKIFGGPATWLLTESDPEYLDLLFALADLGMGFPELGSVSRRELENATVPPFGLPLERDFHFRGRYPIYVYATAARTEGRITENPDLLEEAARSLGL